MKKSEEKKYFKCLVFLLVCFSLFMLNFYKVDSDYFWHIKAGEYMTNNSILTHDVFSWYVNGKYWMSHEWLFEIMLYNLKGIFFNCHVIVYSFICILSLLLLLFIPNRKNFFKNIPYSLIFLVFFFILLIGFIQARPHLLSFLLFAITIYLLYDAYNNESSKKIFVLPIISILWANVHGGSSNLPYLLCLLFIIGGVFSFSYKKIEAKRLTKKQIYKYLIVMVLCMICVCFNIHGVKLFIYPYTNMLDKTMIENITEWKSTSLNYWYHYFYYGFLLFLMFTMLFSNKKIKFIDLLLLGFTSYLGLKSIRFWPYLYMVASYNIFYYVSEKKKDKGVFACLIVFSILLLSTFLMGSKNIFNIKFQNNLNKKVISIIKEEKPKRLYNDYDFGGELIYNGIPVFIDGRADLYSKYNYDDCLLISNLNGDFIKKIDKYDFDYFLVRRTRSINYYLKYNDNYEVIYKNKELILYKKKS